MSFPFYPLCQGGDLLIKYTIKLIFLPSFLHKINKY